MMVSHILKERSQWTSDKSALLGLVLEANNDREAIERKYRVYSLSFVHFSWSSIIHMIDMM
jgi:hypothetical protein